MKICLVSYALVRSEGVICRHIGSEELSNSTIIKGCYLIDGTHKSYG